MAKRPKHLTESARLFQMALKKKKRVPRFPMVKASLQIERTYKKKLRAILTRLEFHIEQKLISKLPAITADYYRFHPTLSRAKNDGLSDNLSHKILDADDESNVIKKVINDVRIDMGQDYSEDEIRAIAESMGVAIADYNEEVILQGIKRVVGVDLFLSEPWLEQQLESFATFNVGLIDSLTDDALSKVQSEVLSGLMSGLRWEDIADGIRDIVDPDNSSTSSRADFIARDQVSKLNGQLTELRQTDLGISKYIWRTSQDDRVRETHRRKEGNIYEWANPPAETGNPGEDYNCRCTAEPYLEDLLGSDNGTSTAPTFFEDQQQQENPDA